MKTPLIALGLLAICVLIVSIVHLSLFMSTVVQNIATIKVIGLSVWNDVNATIPLTSISWGMLEPSSSTLVSCYLRNEANVPVSLELNVGNWNPLNASTYMNVTWNLNETILDVNEIVETTFVLSVSGDISNITTFSFDITIIARG